MSFWSEAIESIKRENEMKRNWEYKKLGDVVSFIGDGDWIESRHQSDNGIRLIQTGNIGNGVFKAKEDRPHFISESTFDELGCTEIYEGDCLVSRLPDPIGRACIIPNMQNRMITAVDCSILRFQKLISSNFFVYYTRSKRYNKEIENYTTGSTRKRISRRNLESVQVPIPPLSEQSRIVAELDLLTGIIDKQNAQLKELDSLAQAIFYDMFGDPIENPKGWEIKKLGDLCVKLTDGTHNSPINTSSGDYPYITAKNIRKNGIDLSDLTYVTKEVHQEIYSRCNPEFGDVLYIKDGITTGIAQVNVLDFEFSLLSSVALLKLDKTMANPYFITGFFNSDSVYKAARSNMGGAAITRLTLTKLKSFRVVVPPLAFQQSFAEKIQSIEKQKESIRASIADTQKLLDYTMDKYFG